jgi:hypothetical protein
MTPSPTPSSTLHTVPKCYQFMTSPPEVPAANSREGTFLIAILLRPGRQKGRWSERQVCLRFSRFYVFDIFVLD